MSNGKIGLTACVNMILMILAVLISSAAAAYAADSGIPEGYVPPDYHSIKPYLMRDLFTEDTVTVSGLKINADSFSSFDDRITFRFFNSTTQETEYLVDAVYDLDIAGFCLPSLKLKKDHNYIIFVEDKDYQLGTKKYVQVLGSDDPDATNGAGLYDFKTDEDYTYKKLNSINVYRRSPVEDPFDDNRYSMMDLDRVRGLPVTYNGREISGVKFRLVSDSDGTIEATSENGRLYADLVEDIQYMVYVDDSEYWIEPFPLSVKDKSEYGEGRYCYDHSTCHRVEKFELIKRSGQPPNNDSEHSAVSINGNASVTGLRFNDLILIERKIEDIKIPSDGLSDYFVAGLYAVNPHRWEISKITGCEGMRANEKLPFRGTVKHVFELKNGQLEPVEFSQTENTSVSFSIDSLGLYPVVIDYTKSPVQENGSGSEASLTDGKTFSLDGSIYRILSASAKTAAFTKAADSRSVTVPDTVTVNGKTLRVTQIGAGAFTGRKIRRVAVGANVSKIDAKAFKGSKAAKMVVKTKALSKKAVKGSLKGSKIRTVQVRVGSKKVNKKFVRKYKKIFTKKNAGRKVSVK